MRTQLQVVVGLSAVTGVLVLGFIVITSHTVLKRRREAGKR